MLDGSGNLPGYAPYGELEAGRPAIEAIATTLPAMLEQYSSSVPVTIRLRESRLLIPGQCALPDRERLETRVGFLWSNDFVHSRRPLYAAARPSVSSGVCSFRAGTDEPNCFVRTPQAQLQP